MVQVNDLTSFHISTNIWVCVCVCIPWLPKEQDMSQVLMSLNQSDLRKSRNQCEFMLWEHKAVYKLTQGDKKRDPVR